MVVVEVNRRPIRAQILPDDHDSLCAWVQRNADTQMEFLDSGAVPPQTSASEPRRVDVDAGEIFRQWDAVKSPCFDRVVEGLQCVISDVEIEEMG